MSCKPTYKGKRYNSLEELKSSTRNHKQEQTKKFAELQERLNNKEFLEGAKNAFESTPELQQFGTQEQYNDYIARVSLGILKNPSSGEYNYTSQVKDIVYHHSDTKITEFKKEFPEGYAAQKGVSPKAKFFLRQPLKEEFLSKRPYLGQYLINIINPNVMPVNADRSAKRDSGIKEGIQEALDNNQDGAIFDNIWDNRTWSDVLVVFEPEQIHILASKADIQGFKEFAQEEKDDLKPFIDESNKIGDESINERLKKYEESIKIPNSVKSKVLEKIEKETEKVKEKLLSLGLKQEGNKFELITNSYATFRMKLKELENVNAIISTNKTSDFYQIIARLKNVDSTMELKKQGELPFTPMEVKQVIQEQQFLNDVADNVFEGLSEEEKQILKKKIENGDYDLNCRI